MKYSDPRKMNARCSLLHVDVCYGSVEMNVYIGAFTEFRKQVRSHEGGVFNGEKIKCRYCDEGIGNNEARRKC